MVFTEDEFLKERERYYFGARSQNKSHSDVKEKNHISKHLLRNFFTCTFDLYMKIFKYYFYYVAIIFYLSSCNFQQYPSASTPLEGGSEFIDGCLKGDFKKAAGYMIDDNENQKDLLKIKRDYDLKKDDDKHAYAASSIIINEDAAVNDTMHIINYKNSYDQFARKVKVVQRNGKWLVDFKYTFNGNL